MSAIHTLKSVFNGGELSPMLDSRVDSEKYASGCKELTNFIPTVYGGIKKRPGTELLGFTKSDGQARLHSFKRSTETNYVLEFGDKYLRFWKGGETPQRVTVNTASVKEWLTPQTIVKWVDRSYDMTEIISHNGVLYSSKSSLPAGTPAPLVGTLWTYYWFPIASALPWNPAPAYYFPGEVVTYNGKLFQSFVGINDYAPETLYGQFFWRDITNYEFTWGNVSGWSPTEDRTFSVGDQVKYNGSIYACIVGHVTSAATKPSAGASWTTYWREIKQHEIGDVIKSGTKYYVCIEKHFPSIAFSSDAAFWRELTWVESPGVLGYEISTPYAVTDIFDLQFTQLNDVLFISHSKYPPMRLSRYNETGWILDEVPFQYAPALDVNENRTSVQIQYDDVPPFGLPWVSGAEYSVGDRAHGTGTTTDPLGYVYACTSGHTAATTNRPGIGADWEYYWELLEDAETWVESHAYVVGDVVYSAPPTQGEIYTCKLAHTSAAANKPGAGASWATYWTLRPLADVGYKVGDRVVAVDVSGVNKYNGEVFTCHTAYNPGNTANDEPGHGSAWANFWNLGTGSQKVVNWANSVYYKQGTKVRIKTVVYECVRSHTSAAPAFTGRVGQIVIPGNKPGTSKGWTRYWRISAADTDLSGMKFCLYATDPMFVESDVGTTWLLELGTGGLVEDIAIPGTIGATNTSENNPLFIQGGYTVTTNWVAETGAMIGTITIEESLNGVTWSVVRQFTQSAANEGNILYNGDAPALGAWYRISATRTAGSGATAKVKLEAISSVYKLPFKITKYEEATKVEGNLVMPGNQLPPAVAIGVSTSIFRRPAFSAKNGFPRTVAFHDSRLWWGGTKTHPTRMWASHTEDYYVYLGGSLDTDGLDLTLATVEANAIQWMASFNRSLVIGTSGDEWTVDSGDTDEALTPTNIRARRRTRYGSNGLPPQLTGDALLWIRRGGGRLHEFAYVYERDSFSAPDLTLLAEHMLHLGDVRQTAFVACPDPVLWIVNGNYLLGLSYNREHNVTAWHKHAAKDASFVSVASIYGANGADEVWFVMKRGTIHSIERFHPSTLAWYHGGRLEGALPEASSCFIDGSTTAAALGVYNSLTGKTVFSGFKNLYHLVGSSPGTLLAPMLDGVMYPYVWGSNIQSGSGDVEITGNHHNKKLVLGYSYVNATMRSMNLEVLLDGATAQGRNWRLIRVVPNVWRSRTFALTSGQSAEREVTLPVETTQILDEIHFSGTFEKQLNWGVKSHNPYPCNLLGSVLKFEVTGG